MKLETLRKTLDKRGNPTNKTRFLNGEPFRLKISGSYFRYIGTAEAGTGCIVEICVTSEGKVLFEQHESNVLKIGPTTCKAFVYVFGNRVNTCLRFDRMSFINKIEESYFEKYNIERIEG
jgi:hypothetical protein